LKADARENFAGLVREMGDLRAKVSTPRASNCVYFDCERLVIRPDPAPHSIEVKLDDRAVLELIDGKWSFHQSILARRIEIKASPSTLERYSRCMNFYLNGALRSPGFPALLSQYRSAVSSFA
jgi:hypothetical protein